MTSPEVEALLREREGYEKRGMTDRVQGVDDALARLGHTRPAPRGVERAVETAPEHRSK